MKDSALRLQDKNVVLVGPFGAVTQAILRCLTEFGADVGYISEQAAGRYIDGVNEAREVHAHYGRAIHVPIALRDEKQVAEVLGSLVGSLGRMDILIDASPLAWSSTTDVPAACAASALLAERMIPFFLAKQRGRVVYLLEDQSLDALRPDGMGSVSREVFATMANGLAAKYRTQAVTVNCLSIGVTDDFVLRQHPRTPSIKKSFEDMAKASPGLKLVDANDVAQSVAYLCSVMSAGITGQMMRLTHGFHLSGAVASSVVAPSVDSAKIS